MWHLTYTEYKVKPKKELEREYDVVIDNIGCGFLEIYCSKAHIEKFAYLFSNYFYFSMDGYYCCRLDPRYNEEKAIKLLLGKKGKLLK